MKKIWILLAVLIVSLAVYLLAVFDVGRDFEDDLSLSETVNPNSYLFKTDLVKISEPLPGVLLANPIRISGFAKGNWFFEASFPIELRDENGRVVGQTIAAAQSEWLTTDFVPFEASMGLPKNLVGRGELVLRKDNPSGLPEFDDEVILPVLFSTSTVQFEQISTITPE